MAANSSRAPAGGGGPGEGFATYVHWLPPLIFLSVTAIAALGGLYWQWPRCEEDACRGPVRSAAYVGPSSGTHPAVDAPRAEISQAVRSSARPTPSAQTPSAEERSTSWPSGTGSEQAASSRTDRVAPSVGSGTAPERLAENSKPQLRVKRLTPSSGTVCGGTAVQIVGSGFDKEKLEVRFGDLLAEISKSKADSNTLVVQTPEHWEGPVDLTITAGGDSVVTEKAFRYECPDHTQARLLLLVVLAGVLGGSAHGLRSLVYFIGNRLLKRSWLPMYFVLPLSSAAISTLFFLVFAAGFFSPQSGDGQSFFLMVGVSAIVGMFSPQAVEKLKKISEAILTPAPAAADALPELVVTGVTPAQGESAGGTEVIVSGSGFAPGALVHFGCAPATAIALTSTTIKVRTPPHVIDKVTVDVTNPDGTKATLKDAFEYT